MDSKKRIYLDIHILQTVPPSCVNRDDTGSPKTARYGGVTRARVSSQAWKRAVRLMFRDMFSKDEVGIRTKRVVELVKERITALKPDAEKPEKLAADALSNAGVKLAKDTAGTDALFFISLAQVSALAKLAVAGEKATGKTLIAYLFEKMFAPMEMGYPRCICTVPPDWCLWGMRWSRAR